MHAPCGFNEGWKGYGRSGGRQAQTHGGFVPRRGSVYLPAYGTTCRGRTVSRLDVQPRSLADTMCSIGPCSTSMTMSDGAPTPVSLSRATLSHLPLEVKSLILDDLAERGRLGWVADNAADLVGPLGQAGGAARARLRRTPLRALSLVSREFRILAEPYLWGVSHLRFRSLAVRC